MIDNASKDDDTTWVEIKETEHQALEQAAEDVKTPTVVVRPQ